MIKRYLAPIKKLFAIFAKNTQHDSLDKKLLRQAIGFKLPKIRQMKYIPDFLEPGEKKIIRIALGVIAAVVLLWAGYFLKENISNAPRNGGEFKEGIVGYPEHINPIYAQLNSADEDLAKLVYSGLLRRDSNGVLENDLAESYTVNDKKTEYIFKIKSGVKWHDGAPFTVQDIIFTFDIIKDPNVQSPLRAAFQSVKVEKIGDDAVKFTLEKPFAPFLSSLTSGIIPKHLWESVGSEAVQFSSLNFKPVGTGPYSFEQSIRDQSGKITSITLKKNEEFHLKKPYIKRINFLFYEAVEPAVSDLLEQKIDSLNFLPYAFKDRATKKFLNIKMSNLPQYTAIFFNQKNNDALKDLNVKRALAFALNKDVLTKNVFGGEAEPLKGPISGGQPGFNDAIGDVTNTPEAAKEALKAAKWEPIDRNAYVMLKSEVAFALTKQNASSTASAAVPTFEEIKAAVENETHPAQSQFWKKGNNTLEITLTTANTPTLIKAAGEIALSWQGVGVVTNLKFIEPSAIIREAVQGRSYEAFLYGQIIGLDYDLYPFWHSSQSQYPGLNLSLFTERELDDLLIKIRESVNENESIEAVKKTQKLFLEKMPAIFLYREPYRYVANKKIKGIDSEMINSPSDRFSDISERYIKIKLVWKKD